jgi:hypothetical protein
MSAIGIVGVRYRRKFFRGGGKKLVAVYDPNPTFAIVRLRATTGWAPVLNAHSPFGRH